MVQTALFITSIVAFLFGLFIFINNPKSSIFKLYFTFSILSSFWIAVNAFVVSGPMSVGHSALLGLSRLITPLSLGMLVVFNFFIAAFIKKKDLRIEKTLLAMAILISMFSFTTTNVYYGEDQKLVLGGLYPYYLVVLAFTVVAALIKLFGKDSARGIKAIQLRYLRLGVLAAFIPAFVFGSIIPLFMDGILVDLGPLFSVFFLVFVGFAVTNHGLFDARLVVARSLGYVLSVAVLGLLYGFAGFSVLNYFLFGDSNITAWQQVAYTVLAVALASSLQPLKKFFNQLTNRFFYQDAYDPQALLSSLNKVIVSNLDLSDMLEESISVIAKNLKPEYCAFALKETSTEKQRIIGDMPNKPSNNDIVIARTHTPKLDHKVIVTDTLEDYDVDLQSSMKNNNISVLVRLTDDVNSEGVGYIILGPKKSGNPYNSQDTRVLETVANTMVIAIENALRFEEIQNFNQTLQERIEDATAGLQRVNKKLIALDKTKDDFVSMASHQLRTPLTSIKGYLSMVLEGDAGKLNKDQKELLGQAFVSSQRMVYLISDLLNVSRLKTGKFVLEPMPVNLADIVESEVAQLRETAHARGLKLVYDKPETFPTLMLDEIKIRQILTNFMDNAIYYTPKGGLIKVDLINGRQSIELTVKDSGIGVPKSEQHNLFSKFYRAGNAKKARPDGTGLGLFMAKKVVIAHGGAIIFKSVEGKGSTFGFTINKTKLKDWAEITSYGQ